MYGNHIVVDLLIFRTYYSFITLYYHYVNQRSSSLLKNTLILVNDLRYLFETVCQY